MKDSIIKRTRTPLLIALSILGILSLSAFSYPAGIPVQQQALTGGEPQLHRVALRLEPGQSVWIHPPVRNSRDPRSVGAVLLQLSSPQMAAAASAGGCLAITERVTEYEVSGAAAFWYQIGMTFCYNGKSVTSLSRPTATWWSNTFYSVTNDGTADYNGGSWGYGEGDFGACYFGCLETYSGYTEIEVYNSGGYNAWADV